MENKKPKIAKPPSPTPSLDVTNPSPNALSKTQAKKAKKQRQRELKDEKEKANNMAKELQLGRKDPFIVFNSKGKGHVKISDLQALVTGALKSQSQYKKVPSQFLPKNFCDVPMIVVLVIDCLTKYHFDLADKDNKFPKLHGIFQQEETYVVKSPGSKKKVYCSLEQILLQKPASGQQSPKPATKTKMIEEMKLTAAELISNSYPSELDKFERFPPPFDGAKKVVAVDCEMCITAVGKELARVSVVDENEMVLYDSFVKPDNPVLDYLTKWSGVSEEILNSTTTRLEDVKQALSKFISSETIIVGHSLENDLFALKMMHECVADSAVLYPKNPTKQSLRFLSQFYLKEQIQAGQSHSSVEDAIQSLRLVKLFGQGVVESNFQQSVLSVPAEARFIGRRYHCNKFCQSQSRAIDCENDEKVIASTIQTISHFTADASSQKDPASATSPSCEKLVVSYLRDFEEHFNTSKSDSIPLEMIAKIDDYVHDIYSALPDNGLLLVFGNRSHFVVKQWENEKNNTVWTDALQAELEKKISVGREHMAFIRLKNNAKTIEPMLLASGGGRGGGASKGNSPNDNAKKRKNGGDVANNNNTNSTNNNDSNGTSNKKRKIVNNTNSNATV